MRIVGGEHKGRIIEVDRNFNARPTTDFAREALFNILTSHFDLAKTSFLDLFSGSGSISFECCSRGCRDIDLVEVNPHFIRFIGKEANRLKMEGIHTVRMDAFRFLDICRKRYDLIFADPPYDMNKVVELPGIILGKGLLLTGGWFILEHSAKHSFNHEPGFFDERKYGNVHFSLFR